MIQLTVLDEIDKRLKTVTQSNGHPLSFNKIERAKLKPFVNGDLPALNYWPGQDIIVSKEFGKETHKMSLSSQAYTVMRDEPFTDVAYRLAHAVITALNRSENAPKVDDEPSYNLGGLVSDLTVQGITRL